MGLRRFFLRVTLSRGYSFANKTNRYDRNNLYKLTPRGVYIGVSRCVTLGKPRETDIVGYD